MGRQEWLTRMALGRSAFQGQSLPPPNRETPEDESTQGSYQQEYDDKGRPISTSTRKQNAALRRAQNEVLILVGVVERKEQNEADAENEATLDQIALSYVLRKENERGEEIDAFADVLAFFAAKYPYALLARLEIGLYNPRLSFSATLTTEWTRILRNGLRNALVALMPGTIVSMAAEALSQLSNAGVETVIGGIQRRALRLRLRRHTSYLIHDSLTRFSETLNFLIEITLLPLSYYSLARTLNLTPPTTYRALLTHTLPLHFRTFHTYAWRPLLPSIRIPIIGALVSPAAILLLYNLTYRNASEETPAFALWTSYRPAPISLSDSHSDICNYYEPSDPCGMVLHKFWETRTQFLSWCGWNMEDTGSWPRATDVECREPSKEEIETGKDPEPGPTHRSTALARLPARWLAMRLDGLLVRILLLPFEVLVMRSVAWSFMQNSPLPKTGQGVQALKAGWLFVPFDTSGLLVRAGGGGGGRTGWSEVAGTVSKVGLGLMLQIAVEGVVFGGVYKLVRWQGEKHFGWGAQGKPVREVNGLLN